MASIRRLSDELQKKSQSELNEVPGRIQNDLQSIRDWIQKQPHLKARTDDQWLIGFLRGCKFSIERTKEKLDYFYTMRSLVPQLFDNRDPFAPEIQEILKAGVLLPLPKTQTPDGPRIIFFRWETCDVNKMPLVNLVKVYFMLMDVLINEDDNCMIAGEHYWVDYKNFPLSYMLQFSPSFMKQLMICMQNAYPVRIKGVYCTNAPSVYETVFNMARAFLSDKLKKRVCMYSENNFNKVYEHIPQSLMPKDYGGDNGTVEALTASWKNKLESYRDWFVEDANYCTFEQLRPGKPKTSADEFGVEGTFRKLDID